MMNKNLLAVAIRYNAVLIDDKHYSPRNEMTAVTANLVANLKGLGYAVSEPLLRAMNGLNAAQLLGIYDECCRVLQVKHNWAPLVKGWDTPTGESVGDHWITMFVNWLGLDKGTMLACGHRIPEGTFPLERYNGCPFCGTQLETAESEYRGQGSKLKMLDLWTMADINGLFADLLQSKTALDATQADTLKLLLKTADMPAVTIPMKETRMLVTAGLADAGKTAAAGKLMQTPVDILRYLWFRKTGFLQIVEPRTIIKRTAGNFGHRRAASRSAEAAAKAKAGLQLKYSRAEGKMAAAWMNGLPMSAAVACELMHPKRNMWVRFIRALRLAEYSRQQGFEHLREIMDLFYNGTYEVKAGRIAHYRLKADATSTFYLLKQRPGLFARSLFSNMLWFGPEITMSEFRQVAAQLPARLLFTLYSYADNYFDASGNRTVKPLGGVSKIIKPHQLLPLYTQEQLQDAVDMVGALCLEVMESRFAMQASATKTIFIDEGLFNIPLAIGDRTENVQQLPAALMGTRFPLEGNAVRLFMQWGKGLPAQHLDMDLSCLIATGRGLQTCSFANLQSLGTKHSGDIRAIPHKTGTAEYIEIDLDQLAKGGAQYAVFTCNAYSYGSITPNLTVGWMNSAHPMKISEKTGVAYDPSCVQHQVTITQPLTKGLVFGVLDVAARNIIWLEMPFGGQLAGNVSTTAIQRLVAKLNAKITIGRLLEVKARAQQLTRVNAPEDADEAYTMRWALNTAKVTQLLADEV